MAFLQPENLASRNDVPERLHEVARHLRDDLPGEVTVWLERTGEGEAAALRREFDGATSSGDDGDCYLVVLDPQAGIAVLQAPSRRQIKASRRRRARLDEGETHSLVVQRATQLGGSVAEVPVESLPVRHVFALPQTSREHAAEIDGRLPLLTRDDFEPGELRPALQRAIGGRILPLGVPERARTRAAVKPEIMITGKTAAMFREPDPASEEIIRTLDREQERMSRHLGAGYRVIRGVAGSGKTLVLTHRARHIARYFPDWRILMMCFNRPLASALRAQVRDCNNVFVRTLDQQARRVLKQAGLVGDAEAKPDFGQRRLDAIAHLRTLTEAQRRDRGYDMVLVDEAQDLGADGLDLAWTLLKPGRDHFVMALDGAHRIYRGKRSRWSPPGMEMTARGRTKELKVNYRNTEQVLEVALSALGDFAERVRSAGYGVDLDVFVKPGQAARRGSQPVRLACGSMRAEADAIAHRIAELRKDGTPPEHIAVLSGWPDLREELLQRIPDAVEVEGKQRDKIADAVGIVPVATLHMLKGLEFPHVVIGGANNIRVNSDEPDEQDRQRRRLLYVAMTRASETLTVTYSGKGIMDAISWLPELRPTQP
ncbi:3'-5' exonuclease [Candidatus Poriferisodalis sp.]|uniref:3'-5' exonuclease n=1 Tax=Candidatus Poriferisodalis sp. TaxID=3101277 RepID=UPI003B590021